MLGSAPTTSLLPTLGADTPYSEDGLKRNAQTAPYTEAPGAVDAPQMRQPHLHRRPHSGSPYSPFVLSVMIWG